MAVLKRLGYRIACKTFAGRDGGNTAPSVAGKKPIDTFFLFKHYLPSQLITKIEVKTSLRGRAMCMRPMFAFQAMRLFLRCFHMCTVYDITAGRRAWILHICKPHPAT